MLRRAVSSAFIRRQSLTLATLRSLRSFANLFVPNRNVKVIRIIFSFVLLTLFYIILLYLFVAQRWLYRHCLQNTVGSNRYTCFCLHNWISIFSILYVLWGSHLTFYFRFSYCRYKYLSLTFSPFLIFFSVSSSALSPTITSYTVMNTRSTWHGMTWQRNWDFRNIIRLESK